MNKSAHQVFAPFVTAPRRYETCQHWLYQNSQLAQCGAPTLHGKPKCTACKQRESQGHSGSSYRSYTLIGTVS